MIDKEQICQLNATPIEGVAQRLGLEVSRHKCLCPYHHDSHPSLSLRGSRYRCFVCGASGGPIDLVMKMRGIRFAEACKWLADESNVVLEHYQPATKPHAPKPFDASRYDLSVRYPQMGSEAAQFLYQERKIAPWVVRYCRLSQWVDKEGFAWLQIPYFTTDWRLVGIQWRNLSPDKADSHGEKKSRFRFPQGSQCQVYNQQVLPTLTAGEALYITEGASDCWAAMSMGYKAVAIPSATLLKPDQIRLLHDLHFDRLNLHICPDQDLPGERLYLQLREHFPHIARHQLPSGCKDLGAYWQSRFNN